MREINCQRDFLSYIAHTCAPRSLNKQYSAIQFIAMHSSASFLTVAHLAPLSLHSPIYTLSILHSRSFTIAPPLSPLYPVPYPLSSTLSPTLSLKLSLCININRNNTYVVCGIRGSQNSPPRGIKIRIQMYIKKPFYVNNQLGNRKCILKHSMI